MGLEVFQLKNATTKDTSFIKRDWTKVYHQQRRPIINTFTLSRFEEFLSYSIFWFSFQIDYVNPKKNQLFEEHRRETHNAQVNASFFVF